MTDKRHTLEWFGVLGGDPIVFDSAAMPFVLKKFTGFSSTQSDLIQDRSPRQAGSTLRNVAVSSRVMTATVVVTANNPDDYWRRREELVRALTAVPQTLDAGETPDRGLLRVYRPNKPALQVPAIPVDSPKESKRPSRYDITFDIEWEASQPFFEEFDSKFITFEAEEGAALTFPLTHPWSSETQNVEKIVENKGDVPTPAIIKMFGEGTTARIINVETGKIIEITGDLAADEYVEISTYFGRKYARLHNTTDGTVTNIMDRVNFDKSDFTWEIVRGTQKIKFEMDTNVSGTANLRFNQRRAGL